jgi:hypothetical protein
MLLLLMAASAAFAEEEYNFLKQGYSFFDTVVGGSGGAIGLLEPLQTQNPPFDFDFVTYEVSYAYLDLEIVFYQEIGVLQQWSLAGGSIGIYEDPSFDLDYGDMNTATNGTLALGGDISEATFLFNNFTGTGSFSGLCTFTGGSRFGELGDLALNDWSIFHGASNDEQVNVPDGYHSRFAGRIFTMGGTPVESTSWSGIRALY